MTTEVLRHFMTECQNEQLACSQGHLGGPYKHTSTVVTFFQLSGFAIMSQWALDKTRKYKQEFKEFPSHRTAIVPYLL